MMSCSMIRRALSIAGLAAATALAGEPALTDGTGAPTALPGDTTAEVVAKLGKPKGIVSRGKATTYYYDRGMVDFVDDRVKTAFLVTPEEAEQRREAREQAAADQRRQAEARRRQLTEEGARELDRQRADKTFNAKPAAERLAFWQTFAERYPYTDVNDRLARARADVDADQGRQKQAAERQALKDRIVAIQARFTQLDADYAASLTHWKRNEIDAERAKLNAERTAVLSRIDSLTETNQAAAGRTE